MEDNVFHNYVFSSYALAGLFIIIVFKKEICQICITFFFNLNFVSGCIEEAIKEPEDAHAYVPNLRMSLPT